MGTGPQASVQSGSAWAEWAMVLAVSYCVLLTLIAHCALPLPQELNVGSGPQAAPGDQILFDYVLRCTNSDSRPSQPASAASAPGPRSISVSVFFE